MLRLTNEDRSIDKWGLMHRDYIKEHSPVLYDSLVLNGTLWTYSDTLNEQAQSRLEVTTDQMKAAEGVTEDLKAENQMAWVQVRNSIRSRAEEIIFHEVIFAE